MPNTLLKVLNILTVKTVSNCNLIKQRSFFLQTNCSFYRTKTFSLTLSFQLMIIIDERSVELGVRKV
jgi:hypothetical protein